MSAAYIFDVEGTLIDCAPETLQCWHETLAAFGVPVPLAHLQRLSGMDSNDMLATLVPSLTESMKYAVVAGAVTGGGLTVIANAPNPAGQAILSRFFDGSVLPIGLLLGALVPTAVATLAFRFL